MNPKSCAILFLSAGTASIPVNADDHKPIDFGKMIISTPLPQSTSNTALPVTVLSGDDLRLKAGSTVGDTLKNELGIHSQSFGPGVGQPVIRGQSGSRAQVLQNGLGSLDASALSPDHANSTEAFWADRIEVLRGPSTLLYGGGAIGGVVNVIDNRIPDKVPERLIEGAAEQRYNFVNEGKTSAFRLDGGKDMFAVHFDGMFRESIPMQIPGLAIDESKEAASHDDHDAEEEVFNSRGRLLNTNSRTYSGTAGFSLIGEKGFIGFSVNYLDNNYGVPPGAHGHHEEEEDGDPEEHGDEGPESVRIDLQQTRYDMKSEIKDPFAFADSLRLRLGYNDYQHAELENGQTGTVYTNRGFDSRVELIQKPWAFFDHGVVGAQTKNSEFEAKGAEAVVPRSDINGYGIFTVQDIHTGPLTFEFGARVEQQFIDADGRKSSSHTPVSGSASALWNVTDQDSVSLSFTRAQRAPDVQELYSDGPHLATQSYDIGNENLIEETAHNLELGFHIDREWAKLDLNLYQNWAQDYIARINTGEEQDHLPVYRAGQRDAQFQGFEAQLTIPLLETHYGSLDTQFFGDYTRGRFTDGSDVPRMPPLRYGMQLGWTHHVWDTNVRITRAEEQDKPGENETETDSYWLLNSTTSYKIAAGETTDFLMFVKANNLLDQTIRHSVSYLRNTAPDAGRAVELGVRVVF
ncbi:TonB-dependent receptor [Methylicorpusculum sp.]|nr:TonB-dependent receptor [Methylicorpusculum sp.]MDP3527903.1 TonB-dependent receptor [Methylicorpusculum sp.]MDZ4153669.1 TonB-dependent receptor [Methylicorpusculum sp.]